MNTLILRMRADTVKANLEEVRSVVTFLAGRTRHLTELREASNALKATIAVCQEELKQAGRSVEDISLSEGSAREQREAALVRVASAKGRLDEGAKQLSELIAGFTTLSRRPMRIAKNVKGKLRRTLADEAKGLLEGRDTPADREAGTTASLRDVYDDIDAAEQTGIDPDEKRALIQAAWTKLTAVEAELPELFSEYVEFLGGLALRDAGRDAGICRIVDKLMTGYDREIDQNPWHSLSIPGFQERISVDKTNIIRLGFTDWSRGDDFSHPAFWSIPLTAHQFGLLLAGHDRLPDYVNVAELPDWLRSDHGILLADAFATYTLGLAYGCAEILLRLDPQRRLEPPAARPVGIGMAEPAGDVDTAQLRSSQIRAAVVREMLSRLANVDNDFTNGVERLSELWDDALSVAAGDAAAAAVPAEDDEARELSQFVDRVRDFVDYVSNRETDFAYNAEMYAQVLPWQQALIEGDLGAIRVRTPTDPSELIDQDEYLETRRSTDFDNLRHLLNASWVARLFHPTETAAIQESAWKLWQHMVGEKPEAGDQGRHGIARVSETVGSPERVPPREPSRTAPRGPAEKTTKVARSSDPKRSQAPGGVRSWDDR